MAPVPNGENPIIIGAAGLSAQTIAPVGPVAKSITETRRCCAES
jgi:hypothetical protein